MSVGQRESKAEMQKQLDESWKEVLSQVDSIPEEEMERFLTEFRATAERQVRRDLVIETLAERESLTAREADVDAKIQEMAEKRNQNPGQVYAQLQKAGRLREIERGITEDRVFAWLLARNTVEQT